MNLNKPFYQNQIFTEITMDEWKAFYKIFIRIPFDSKQFVYNVFAPYIRAKFPETCNCVFQLHLMNYLKKDMDKMFEAVEVFNKHNIPCNDCGRDTFEF